MNNQGKKIYVNGGIAIMTPFFRYQNAGALWNTPPDGSEQIECDSRYYQRFFVLAKLKLGGVV